MTCVRLEGGAGQSEADPTKAARHARTARVEAHPARDDIIVG
jgi:hypothetical protein